MQFKIVGGIIQGRKTQTAFDIKKKRSHKTSFFIYIVEYLT